MSLIAASLFLVSFAAGDDQMPADFLKAESPESSKWLDDRTPTTWTRARRVGQGRATCWWAIARRNARQAEMPERWAVDHGVSWVFKVARRF